MNFKYNLSDEQVKLAYNDILGYFKTEDIRDTDYHEDIALLMAQINTLLSSTSEVESEISLEKWKFILELIKLKATLIKENRLERERNEKAQERRMKLESIPIDDYRNAIASVISIICRYVSPEHMSNVISELSEVTANLTNNQSK